MNIEVFPDCYNWHQFPTDEYFYLVYGYISHSVPVFRRVQPASGPPIYTVDDDEIDFETMLKQNPIPVPRKIRYAGERHCQYHCRTFRRSGLPLLEHTGWPLKVSNH